MTNTKLTQFWRRLFGRRPRRRFQPAPTLEHLTERIVPSTFTNDAKDFSWGTPGNWSMPPNHIPAVGDNVSFNPGQCWINSGYNAVANSVNVSAGVDLVVRGTLSCDSITIATGGEVTIVGSNAKVFVLSIDVSGTLDLV